MKRSGGCSATTTTLVRIGLVFTLSLGFSSSRSFQPSSSTTREVLFDGVRVTPRAAVAAHRQKCQSENFELVNRSVSMASHW
mmetsp:Transcript_123418/g.308375  ORF Transcript_123418/g.308375 Transcript_123418/m.308375 type:complete len:82 (+) Transcript_123418:716-961(+)